VQYMLQSYLASLSYYNNTAMVQQNNNSHKVTTLNLTTNINVTASNAALNLCHYCTVWPTGTYFVALAVLVVTHK